MSPWLTVCLTLIVCLAGIAAAENVGRFNGDLVLKVLPDARRRLSLGLGQLLGGHRRTEPIRLDENNARLVGWIAKEVGDGAELQMSVKVAARGVSRRCHWNR